MSGNIKAGTVIDGPQGMSYEFSRDLSVGEVISIDLFTPRGGAPTMKAGEPMPEWVAYFFENRGGTTP